MRVGQLLALLWRRGCITLCAEWLAEQNCSLDSSRPIFARVLSEYSGNLMGYNPRHLPLTFKSALRFQQCFACLQHLRGNEMVDQVDFQLHRLLYEARLPPFEAIGQDWLREETTESKQRFDMKFWGQGSNVCAFILPSHTCSYLITEKSNIYHIYLDILLIYRC